MEKDSLLQRLVTEMKKWQFWQFYYYFTWYTWFFLQAGIVASLDALVKEFVAASNEEKKAVFARIEEEVEKLTGSSARYSMGVGMWLSNFYYNFPIV